MFFFPKLRFLFIIVLLVLSCNNPEQADNIKIEFDSIKNIDSLKENEYLVYTVPSPLQISTTLKLLNINFSENITLGTKVQKPMTPNRYYNALNLGISLVDLGYVSIYQKTQLSYSYLVKIENLLDELDIQNQNSIFAIERFKNTINNSDSISKFILEAQSNIDEYFKNTNEQEIGVLVLSGLYIEGLYITIENYTDLVQNKTLNKLKKNYLNNLLFQQKIFIDNLIELQEKYIKQNDSKIITEFKELKNRFIELNISFKFDRDAKKINDIKLDNKKIVNLKESVFKIRTDIINYN